MTEPDDKLDDVPDISLPDTHYPEQLALFVLLSIFGVYVFITWLWK